ncbi:MAG: hypothetical protein ABW139_10760 [Candidatus Thiodiazotropha sp. DIVDIV]
MVFVSVEDGAAGPHPTLESIPELQRHINWVRRVISILEAGQALLNNPLEAPFIPNWKRVLSAMPDFISRLYEAVAEDNQ